MLWLVGIPAFYLGMGTVTAAIVDRGLELTWPERAYVAFWWPWALFTHDNDYPSM